MAAARFQLISFIALPADLHDRCVGKEVDSATSPIPVTIHNVPYVVWFDSTLATKPNRPPSVKKLPKPQRLPDHLKSVKQHNILFRETYSGGTLVNLLEWVNGLVPAEVAGSVFVGVWSFNDFFAKLGPNPRLPCITSLVSSSTTFDRLIERLNTQFEKSVMICGGTSQTWNIRDTVYDIHAARVREPLRQGGILVVNPIDLFDTRPKRDGDPWHFLCLSYQDRVDGYDPTLHSLETLISHVVLVAHHLIEPTLVIKDRVRTWADDMKPKSGNAHITLAVQYDPREDVLPLSYGRRMNDQGAGTIDLQSFEEFGVEPSRLRGRALKARTQPYDAHHLREGRELVYTLVEVEIGMGERRSPSASPVQCSNEDLSKGQMLAGGSWSDVAVEIVGKSKRHAGTKNSISPFHWMIFQSARQSMVPSAARCLASPQERAVPTTTTISRSAANANGNSGLLTLLFLVSVLSVSAT